MLLLTKDLAPLRAAAKVAVDTAAEQVRLHFITPGAGQAMAYQEKYDEAIAFLADQNIDESLIPAIVGEVGVTAPTKYEVAQVVVNMQAMWRQISATVESLRLSAKNSIDAAANPAQIDAAADVDWSPIFALAGGVSS